ncbi:MAG: Fic family protein [Streptosporangiales bacterium]|nr:Fic family protein [Streptosporangiales bacterium]MBO0891029.1 Fic family protein [Acidothermales bacterium]
MHRPDDAWHSYFEPGTEVLRNVHGIRDQWTLATYERRQSAAAFDELRRREPPQRFDLGYLQSCHRELLGSVYPWAGRLRYVNIVNPTDPAGAFLDHRLIGTVFRNLTHQLQRERELRSCTDPRQWADRAGYYWAQVNNCHPFREGNGRSTRLFIAQLARAGGHDLDWSRIDREFGHEAVDEASRAGRVGQYEPMRTLLQYAATGGRDRSTSPRAHLEFLDRQLRQELYSQTAIHVGQARPREARYLDQARRSATRALAVLPGRYPSRGRQPNPPETRPERSARRTAAQRMSHDRNRDPRDSPQQYRGRGYNR